MLPPIHNFATINRVSEPREDIQQLFQLADIPRPEIFPTHIRTISAIRKKLKKTVDKKKIKKNGTSAMNYQPLTTNYTCNFDGSYLK
jgi:hypothetical protein